jgi:hypothetical protein
MKNMMKIIGIAFIFSLIVISCNTTPSLQKYFVESKENDAFISIDLPASILQLKNNEVSEDVKNTLNTISKINFLALPITASNLDLYASEKEKVTAILKNSKYKQLMRMKFGEGNVSVNYLGEEEAIDEVIIFGSDNEKGFAIVRVTGENMNPSEILRISQEIKLDGDSSQLQQLEGLLGSLK